MLCVRRDLKTEMLVYNKIYREEFLAHPYELTKSNRRTRRGWLDLRGDQIAWAAGFVEQASGRGFVLAAISLSLCGG